MGMCADHHLESDHDPTMASCCQRDLAQQAQDRKCLQRLQAADRSTVRADMTAAVLSTHNDSHPPPPSQESFDLSSEGEAGETHTCDHGVLEPMENAQICQLLEWFAELQHFRIMRLQQLKQEQQQKTALESQGHGVLIEVSQPHLQVSESLKPEHTVPMQRPVHRTLHAASAGPH